MRGLRELLPLIIVTVIVAVILLSWLRTGAQFLARSSSASGSGFVMGGSGVGAPGAVPAAMNTPDARLKQLAIALQMYLADYNNTLPPMSSPVDCELALLPYVLARDYFRDPATGDYFGINASLSFRSMNAIPNPADIVVFYQQKPGHGTKKRWVAFLDGHVKAVDEQAWRRLSKASGIGKKPAASNAKRKIKSP